MVTEKHLQMQKKDEAVSPIMGVMLILVITILVAGVVAVFATQFTDTTQDKLTITKVKYVGLDDGGLSLYTGLKKANMDASNSYTRPFGLVFEVISGEPIDLKNLRLDLDDKDNPVPSSRGGKCTIAYNDYIASDYTNGGKGAGLTKVLPPVGATKRFVPYPYPAKVDTASTIINPGERFMIMGEYYQSSNNMFGVATVRADEGSTSRYNSAGYFVSAYSSYVLVDESTGNVLASGNLGEGKLL